MPRTFAPVVLPNPDDPVNGVIPDVTVSIFRNTAGVAFFKVQYPADPDGDFIAPLSQIAAADRLKGRDFALACLVVYKTARSFV